MIRFRIFRAMVLTMTVSSALLAVACSNDDPDTGPLSDDPALAAPESLAGKTYDFTILDGSNAFADSGTFSVTLDETNYVLTDDGEAGSTAGQYTYSHTANQGTILADDSAFGRLTFFMTYTSAEAGNYAIQPDLASLGEQSGTFSERR